MSVTTTRRTERRPQVSAGFRGRPDWVAVRANLVWMHGHTHEEEHEAVHLIAESLGADKDWLHDAVRIVAAGS